MYLKRLAAFIVYVNFSLVIAQTSEDRPILGVEGRSVILNCDLPHADPPQVTWTDLVYNMNSEPAKIFSSANNPSLQVNTNHSNARNFVVNPNYSLKIDHLSMDSGTGLYICTSVVKGRSQEIRYYVNVHGKNVVNCTGKSELDEGETTQLDCSGHYTGQQPDLAWYKAETEQPSIDRFDIKLARRTLDLNSVSYKDDGERLTCRMKLGKSVKECGVTLSVRHLVRDVRFSPNVTSLHAGEELRCLASGNPAPRIDIDPPSQTDKSGVGMRAIVMEKDWTGKKITVTCKASNTLNGKHELITRNITIDVLVEKQSTGALGDSGNALGIIVGLVIAILLLVAIVVAVILIRRRKSQKPPKGSKPLPTKEQISHSQNGQNGQRGQPV